MDDKVFRQLQRKFFYAPLIVGWILVILACSLVFVFLRYSIMAQVEKSLLNASVGPYFQSDNLIYVFDRDGKISTLQMENSYSDAEIEDVVDNLLKPRQENKFKTQSGKRYMYRKITEKTPFDADFSTKYVVIEFTGSFKTILSLGILLFVIAFVGMLTIFLFYYFFSKKAIQPVKQSFVRQQELIANASHELKTPLTIVRTNLELVESAPESTVADNKKWLESADYQIKRMHSLIIDMLELTKFESMRSQAVKEKLCVNDVVEGMLLSFEATCYEKSIQLNFISEQDLYILADKAQIEKLAGILIDNAIKYTPEHGEINVRIQKQRRYAVMRFSNTGEGISQENIENIFDRFFKVDASHKETSNSFGLGLSIAKSIVNSMKGNIRCESEIGKYTEFIVELPLHTITDTTVQ